MIPWRLSVLKESKRIKNQSPYTGTQMNIVDKQNRAGILSSSDMVVTAVPTFEHSSIVARTCRQRRSVPAQSARRSPIDCFWQIRLQQIRTFKFNVQGDWQ
jgi:hypothetical protein